MPPSPLYPFLDTTCVAGDEPFEPVLRSSLAHRHRELDARFEQRDGWLVPVSYPRENAAAAVGLSDVSHVGKLEVFAEGEPADGAILESVAVGPGHRVLLCRYAKLASLRERIEPSAELVLDRTSAWCALLLSGPDRELLLRRLSHIAEVPGRGPIGKVPGTVLARSSGYWLLFSQEFAQYVWDLAADLALPLHGGPLGVDALPAGDPLLAVGAAARV